MEDRWLDFAPFSVIESYDTAIEGAVNVSVIHGCDMLLLKVFIPVIGRPLREFYGTY